MEQNLLFKEPSLNRLDNKKGHWVQNMEYPSVPQSLNELNFSPESKNNSNNPEWNSVPVLDEFKNVDTSLEKDIVPNKKKSMKFRSKPLPKINNPKAEDRLKALMDLLGKKNNGIGENEPRMRQKNGQYTSVIQGKGDINKIQLPPLSSLTPMPLTEKNMNIMHKEFIAPGDVKIAVKKRVPRDVENNQGDLRDYLNKHGKAFFKNKPRSLKDLINDENKKVVVKPSTKEPEASNRSPRSGRLSYPKKVDKIIEHDQKNIFLKAPLPAVDFDARIHKVSLDDAFDKLDQLTNQSGNARKDLLRIQENALAIRIKYEKNHRSLDRINLGKENRNQ